MNRARRSFILGLDTGGEHLCVGLVRVTRLEEMDVTTPSQKGLPVYEVLDEVVYLREQKQRDSMLRLVSTTLARHNLSPGDLSLIAVGRGPGSFTGIRLGMSLALGLSLAAEVPVWPVCSLMALAMNVPTPDAFVMPLIDARKGEVYGALFRMQRGYPEVLLAPAVGTCEAVLASGGSRVRAMSGAEANPIALGSGALAYGVATSMFPSMHISRGSMVAMLAEHEWRGALFDASRAPQVDPTYLRRPEAELALEAG
jgi:tRNA threonylcarbamoyl adenosine modification protein YeaZ